jgi:hypothetical protein
MTVYLAAFIIASVIGWYPCNILIWFLWTLIARYAGLQKQTPSTLARKIGGLESMFYVFAVMYAKPELVTGWLVMKTFSG